MTKSHTKWLQDIEISVYLSIFSLKNVILELLKCSAPVALIRIKTVLILLAKKKKKKKKKKQHKKSVNKAVLFIYLFILRNCLIFPLNDYIFKLRRYAHSRKEFGYLASQV